MDELEREVRRIAPAVLRFAVGAAGTILAREGQTVVNAPDTKTIRLYVDDEPFDPVGTELPGSTVWVAPPVAAVVVVPWRAIAE